MTQPYPAEPIYQPQPYQPQPYQAQPAQGFAPPPSYGYPPPVGAPAFAPQLLAPPPAYVPPGLSRGRKLLLGGGIGIGAIIVILTVIGLVVGAQPAAAKKIALPSHFDGYSKLDNDASRAVENSIRSSVASNQAAGAMFNAASIGVYSHNTGDVPALISVALPTSAVTGLASKNAQVVVGQLLSQVATPGQTVPFPGGGHGGAERCTYATFGTAHETMCAWSDKRTTGLLVSVEQPAVTPGALGMTGYDFRDTVD